jgi:hypothetical protein
VGSKSVDYEVCLIPTLIQKTENQRPAFAINEIVHLQPWQSWLTRVPYIIMADFNWINQVSVSPKKYLCGYCSVTVGPDKGLYTNTPGFITLFMYFCSNCGQPTFFDAQQRQFPGPRFGGEVKHLPRDIEQLYGEARSCMSGQAYTPAVLACRKILMSVAVSLGAKAGDPFISYVKYLADNGYVPPNGKHWVDHIRKKSNEANHEIALMSKDDAEQLITFSEMLLKFIFELPNVIPAPATITS